MLSELWQQLPTLGISGLLFVMWWFERQERLRGVGAVHEATGHAGRLSEINDHLLDVIRSNTEASIALRDELRIHRETEMEWMNRLSRQLENIEIA